MYFFRSFCTTFVPFFVTFSSPYSLFSFSGAPIPPQSNVLRFLRVRRLPHPPTYDPHSSPEFASSLSLHQVIRQPGSSLPSLPPVTVTFVDHPEPSINTHTKSWTSPSANFLLRSRALYRLGRLQAQFAGAIPSPTPTRRSPFPLYSTNEIDLVLFWHATPRAGSAGKAFSGLHYIMSITCGACDPLLLPLPAAAGEAVPRAQGGPPQAPPAAMGEGARSLFARTEQKRGELKLQLTRLPYAATGAAGAGARDEGPIKYSLEAPDTVAFSFKDNAYVYCFILLLYSSFYCLLLLIIYSIF